jgi:peptidyl-prolyl cis-trans isomerase A (cyclophilin A)
MRTGNIRVLAAVALFAAAACRSGAQPKPTVIIETDSGTIVVELAPDKAPITVGNFLKYVDERRYDGGSFYRAVTLRNQLPPERQPQIEVIQGGIDADSAKRLPPIPHEPTSVSGLRHVDGVISMARGAPGSASSEFFFVINNQPALDFGGLRNPDGQGFAAFGKVLRGMDVVRKIQAMPSADAPPQRMLTTVRIRSIRRTS